jgi:hypothetical protein
MTVSVPRFPALTMALLGSLVLASAARAESAPKPAGDPVVVRDDTLSTPRERPGLLPLAPLPAASAPMTAPRLVSARVDWVAATRALGVNAILRPAAASVRLEPSRLGRPAPAPAPLLRINAAMAQRFAGIAQSPVPVLLPFDTDRLLTDLERGAATPDSTAYLNGFNLRPHFFYPGPSGYDAAFALRAPDSETFRDIKFAEPFQIVIAGSALLYDLDDQKVSPGDPVPELESEFPGIRRLIHEHHLRYTFVRFGVPYAVSIACFNAGVSRYRMPTCRDATRVAVHFLRSLRVAGGLPKPARTIEPIPIARPPAESPSFSYFAPGRLLPGTGFRGHDGRADRTVYSQIRFPLLDAPAFVNSQLFQSRNRPIAPGHQPNYSYPWRDNFCERRGFPVGQCPAGHGHQGQDLRPARCEDGSVSCRPHDLVAVRDGAIMRSPGQEALYLFVNTETEHLRFRYLHMDPRKMDRDGVLSGRRVREGEVIAEVSNFSKKEAGTSYHLHFDVQVPTRHGWVFVNPYMTLVASYERLIAARGEELPDPTEIATTDKNPALGAGKHAERENVKRKRVKKRGAGARNKQKRRSRR